MMIAATSCPSVALWSGGFKPQTRVNWFANLCAFVWTTPYQDIPLRNSVDHALYFGLLPTPQGVMHNAAPSTPPRYRERLRLDLLP